MWWGPIWRGLFVDPAGKHYRTMGRSLWLYGYLIVHADRKTGTLYRKVSTVARDMQVSARTVQAWFSLLKRHGYIRAETTGRGLVIGIEKWRPVVKRTRGERSAVFTTTGHGGSS
jgi:Mn-dependent DtxR family transcriptional regulator